jgi:hypothetical protein
MLNSQYFLPMEHKPLPDIRKYALLTNQHCEFYGIVKPEGIDVYINNGQMFDLYHNEVKNDYLKFHFEKLLKTSSDQKMTIVGTLTSTNILTLLRYKSTLFGKTKSPFDNIKFVVHDIIFPVFNADHDYRWRYDIAKKVIGVLPNCSTASKVEIKDQWDLNKLVVELFSINSGASVLVFKADGKFTPGPSQLYYDDMDTVSYKVEANQRYRGHIKKVVSTTLKFDDGNKIEVASYIITKFKRDFIDIPIDQSNLALRRFIWENKNNLKEHPFWFTGYTLLVEKEDKTDYITIINKFHSFIP